MGDEGMDIEAEMHVGIEKVTKGAARTKKEQIPLDQMRAYRACLNCRNRKSKCDLDINQGRPVSGFVYLGCLFAGGDGIGGGLKSIISPVGRRCILSRKSRFL
jgi:hypothetical protein